MIYLLFFPENRVEPYSLNLVNAALPRPRLQSLTTLVQPAGGPTEVQPSAHIKSNDVPAPVLTPGTLEQFTPTISTKSVYPVPSHKLQQNAFKLRLVCLFS